MRNIKRAGVLMAAALSALVIIGASPGAAQADLNCGDPGTFHNMPVPPDDPNGLDADGNGIGCEDDSVFGGEPTTPPTDAPPVTEAPAPEPAAPAAAGLDCGDPGTFHNMPVPPDDPNGLDADDDGIGCEDGSVFGDAPPPAPPAVAQPGEPTFTG